MKANSVACAAVLPTFLVVASIALSQPPEGTGGGGDPRALIEQRLRESGIDPAALAGMRAQFEAGNLPAEAVRAFAVNVAAAQALTRVDDGGGRGEPGNNQRENNQQVTPSVVLKGIYRLGDTYHVSVQSSDGVTQTAQWQSGSNAPVLNGYQIQAVDARNVTMSLPSGAQCQTATGMSCVGRNQMAVTLVPTQPRRNLTGNNNQNNNQQQNNNNNQQWWNGQNNANANLIRQLLGGNQANQGARGGTNQGARGGGNNAGGRGGN